MSDIAYRLAGGCDNPMCIECPEGRQCNKGVARIDAALSAAHAAGRAEGLGQAAKDFDESDCEKWWYWEVAARLRALAGGEGES